MRTEKTSATFLSAGLAAITLLVYTNQVFDPVNSPKLLLLGIVASYAFLQILVTNFKKLWSKDKILIVFVLGMLVAMFNSVLNSQSPRSQNLYGVQGRNTGFLMHIALLIIFLSVLTFQRISSLKRVFFGFLLAGLGNVLYCLWVLLFGDFINWNNQYKSLLGTLGNPNFVSSLLAIFLSGFLILFQEKIFTKKYIVPALLFCALVLLEIRETQSSQGFVVFLVGIFLSIIYVLPSAGPLKWARILLICTGAISAILGVFAFFNRGPFAPIIYQDTLGYRKEYWLAGLKMGLENPLSGVGMDSYGDWYRHSRTAASLISPGSEVVTNVAHNIYIDAFASGGIPLLIFYLAPVFMVSKICLHRLFSRQRSDVFFVALASSWVGYVVQASISINQIGLAIWGWVLSALIINYEKIEKSKNLIGSHARSSNRNTHGSLQRNSYFLTPLTSLSSVLLGFMIYCPPLMSDHRWAMAYASSNPNKIVQAFEPSYFYPQNSQNYFVAAKILEQNGFHRESLKLTLDAINFNSRSFESWKLLSELKFSSENQKNLAISKMKQLDPHSKKLSKL